MRTDGGAGAAATYTTINAVIPSEVEGSFTVMYLFSHMEILIWRGVLTSSPNQNYPNRTVTLLL